MKRPKFKVKLQWKIKDPLETQVERAISQKDSWAYDPL